MTTNDLVTIKSVNEVHHLLNLGKPLHPLVSIIRHTDDMMSFGDVRFATELYVIAMKENIQGALAYGRSHYDFEEGTVIFMAPGQVIAPTGDTSQDPNGWTLIFHPDLIRCSELGNRINNYSFFDYEANEALHLSVRERENLRELVHKIESEIDQNFDQHSQDLIVTNIELLLKYCTRYYDRQFYTRSNVNHDVAQQFSQMLKRFFESDEQLEHGIPSVSYCANKLNISANYLSDLLKKETSKSAQDHIHHFVIEKAKTILLNSSSTISQVAFQLGFEYSQHFSRLFKSKTGLTPKEYRNLH